MNKKGKTIGLTILFILDILLVFVYSLTIQFGWNNILTTIDEKLSSFFARLTSGISKKIEEQKSKKIEKELNDRKNLEEIIKQKAKETITND